MGAYLVFIGYGVPCLVFLILYAIPKTRRWLESKGIF